MKIQFATYLIAACALFSGAGVPINAMAQSEVAALSAVSAWPVASVVLGASAAAGAVLAIPVVLSTAGAVLVVKTVESSARGTVMCWSAPRMVRAPASRSPAGVLRGLRWWAVPLWW